MLIFRLAFLMALFLYPVFSFAYPEYHFFSEGERSEINSPRRVGAEYESDRLAYQFLSSWNNPWLKQSKVFQYTAGSLGATRFYTRGRFRFNEKITENFQFQLSYFESGDFKSNRQAFIFEFLYQWNTWLQFSIYGQPFSLKKEDDAGLATIFHLSPSSQVRVFYTAVDFTHNKRTEDASTYEEQPSSYGAVWRSWQNGSKEFMEFYIKNDSKLRHVFNSGREYIYGGHNAGWVSRHSLDDRSQDYLQTELNYQKSFEGDSVNTDQGITRWDYESFDALVQFEDTFSWFNILGIRTVYSQWKSLSGHVVQNDILPHAWFMLYHQQDGANLHKIDLGYEFTWHRGRGDTSLRDITDHQSRLEHRMNARYRLNISDKTHLNVLLTFDLDDFGSGETWEGGALQFSQIF